MEIQQAACGKQYQQEAKKYVINMTGKRKKLHIKNGCHWAKFLTKYYSFDTLAEAKNCGVESTLCMNCFRQ